MLFKKKLRISIITLGLAALFLQFTSFVFSDNKSNGIVSADKLEIVSFGLAADPYSKSAYESFIKLKVYNNSDSTITRAFFKVCIKSGKDAETVYTEKFMKPIDGGLDPYSFTTINLYPKNSSFWALHNIPKNSKLLVETYKLFSPKANSPWHYEYKFNYPDRKDYSY